MPSDSKPHQALVAESRALIERVRANRPYQEARARIARQRLENARRLLAKHLERR